MSEAAELVELERRDIDMALRYGDGSELIIGYVHLRSNCPCANCGPKREDEGRRKLFVEEISLLRNEKPQVEPVGTYGLRFVWGSGCNMGIYGFELLRELGSEEHATAS